MFNGRVITVKCTEEVIQLMHEYFDEELSPDNEKKLTEHLNSCSECFAYFQQLKKAVTFVQGSSQIQAPDNFTVNVMAKLPPVRRKVGLQSWMKLHPLMTAASVFLVLMTGSLVSSWQNDHKFSVTNQSNLVVQNHKVIVPEGKVVKGDVIVRNGELRIEGEVQGDVTVINGDHYLASAGHVTGEIEEVNKVFDWLWYQMKRTYNKVISVFNTNDH